MGSSRLHAYQPSLDCFSHAVEKVSTELKKQIIQARTAKKLTQAQLAQVGKGSLVVSM